MKKMVGYKKIAVTLITMGISLLLWTGCGASSSSTDDMSTVEKEAASNMSSADYGYDSYENEQAEENDSLTVNTDYANEVETASDNTQTKLIKNVDLSVETKSFNAMIQKVQEKTTALGGYIESQETYNGSSYGYYKEERYSNLVIRIPQEKLDTFLTEVSALGNVTRKTESVEDVTLTYVDLVSHKEALETEKERLLELMKQAETLEDTLTIEERLTELRYQLESMESQLRTLNNKVNYSTITMCVNEVEELTPVEEQSTWERISSGFAGSVSGVVHGFGEFIIGFIIAIPYLLVWAVVIVVILVIVKSIIKKRHKKNENETK